MNNKLQNWIEFNPVKLFYKNSRTKIRMETELKNIPNGLSVQCNDGLRRHCFILNV